MQDTILVAANTQTANLIAGQLHEFVGNGAQITLAVCGSAIGLRTTLILNIPVIQDQAVNTANRFPVIPDDVMYQGRVRACRVFLQARNTTGGALTFNWRVDVN